jgi:hypothetical protein
MPKSKNRKGHKKKVNNRNSNIKNAQRQQEKYQKEQFDALVKQFEQQELDKKNLEKGDAPDIDQVVGIDGPEI